MARRHTSQVGETKARRTRKRVVACSHRGGDVVVAGLTSQVISRTVVVLDDEDAAVPALGVGAISSGSAGAGVELLGGGVFLALEPGSLPQRRRRRWRGRGLRWTAACLARVGRHGDPGMHRCGAARPDDVEDAGPPLRTATTRSWWFGPLPHEPRCSGLLLLLLFSPSFLLSIPLFLGSAKGKIPRCGCAGGGGGLGGEAERPSYGAVADTTHGQFCPAAIHGVQAMAATWLQSRGPPLGFGGVVQGQRGRFPPGRASEAGARAPARLSVRAGRGPARTSRV
jgi:hypothetical protein